MRVILHLMRLDASSLYASFSIAVSIIIEKKTIETKKSADILCWVIESKWYRPIFNHRDLFLYQNTGWQREFTTVVFFYADA